MHDPTEILAAAAIPTDRLIRMLPAIVGLGVVVVVGGVLLVRYRRRLFAEEQGSVGAPLTLHDLRTMRAKGEMTEEEFERAKAVMIAELKGIRSPMPPPSGETPGERRAPPGYDLTGEPLPEPDRPRSSRIRGARLTGICSSVSGGWSWISGPLRADTLHTSGRLVCLRPNNVPQASPNGVAPWKERLACRRRAIPGTRPATNRTPPAVTAAVGAAGVSEAGG